MLKAVAFDLGGTLFKDKNSPMEASRAQWKEMKRRGYEIGWKEYRKRVDEAWETFTDKYGKTVRKYESGLFLEFFCDIADMNIPKAERKDLGKLFYKKFSEFEELRKGSEEVIDYCKKAGMITGVITNGNRIMTERRLDKGNIRGKFDHVIYSVDVGEQKSSLKPFEVFLNKTDLDGENCLMVGNTLDEDMHAKKLGFKTVLISEGGFDPEESENKPDYIISNISSVKAIVRKLQ